MNTGQSLSYSRKGSETIRMSMFTIYKSTKSITSVRSSQNWSIDQSGTQVCLSLDLRSQWKLCGQGWDWFGPWSCEPIEIKWAGLRSLWISSFTRDLTNTTHIDYDYFFTLPSSIVCISEYFIDASMKFLSLMTRTPKVLIYSIHFFWPDKATSDPWAGARDTKRFSVQNQN